MKDLFNNPITVLGIQLPFSLLEFLLRFVLPVLGFLAFGLLFRLLSGRISRRIDADDLVDVADQHPVVEIGESARKASKPEAKL